MKLSSWLQFIVASHWKPEFARTCPQAASESGGFTQLLQLTSELSSHAREPEGGKGKYCFFNGFTRINQASLGKKQMLRQGHFTSPFLWGTYIVQNRVGISWQQNTRLYQWQMTDKTPFQKDNKTFYNEEHLTTSLLKSSAEYRGEFVITPAAQRQYQSMSASSEQTCHTAL